MKRSALVACLLAASACSGADLPGVSVGLVVSDQTLAVANQLLVTKVVAPDAGFVVIRADADGVPGALVGKRAVPSGTSADLIITLERAAGDGERLHAILHHDSGTVGVFAFDSDPTVDPPVTTAAGDVVKASFTVTVSDQPPAPSLSVADQVADPADRVVVAQVVSPGPGFVVIYADDAGARGAALGHAAVGAGASEAVQVDLPRALQDGERLFAVLHVDDGAVGTYEFDGVSGLDAPVKDAEGAEVTGAFTVTLPEVTGPELEAEDQEVDPIDQVTVARVKAEAPGFVVIREDDAGRLGAVLGHAAVSRGTTTAVAVTLSREVRSGERLRAVLHLDDGAVGAFEFDGENGLDAPVADGTGAIVSAAFTVTFAPRVTAEDQDVSPTDEVVVALARVDGPGWIVIRADDGGPGPVLGQVSLQHGTQRDLRVTLSRHVRSHETLFAALHTDDGVLGAFEFDGVSGLDAPVLDRDGNPVAPPFVVRFEPALAVDTQFCDPTTVVTVGAVTSDGPGFVVIHEGAGEGPVLGHAPVPNGAHPGPFPVTLQRAVRQGETLVAVLHQDTGAVGTFEFTGPGSPDGPATNSAGAPVAPDFVVRHLELTAGPQTVRPTDQVHVSTVVTDAPGFVVVYDDDAGAPGRPIGAAPVDPQTPGPVTVPLERSVLMSELTGVEALHVRLHRDDGTLGVFEPALDLPRELDSALVQASFTADFLPVMVATDQSPAPSNQVVVAEVVSPGPGWVVIHQSAGAGVRGTRLGWAHLDNGTNQGVVVTLSRAATPGEILWAALRVDRGVVGVAEFAGTAPPDFEVTNDQGRVEATFQILP
jgi:hypothetical protein